jgi:hypothetical protein
VRFWPGASMIHVGAASYPHMKDKTFAHFRSHLSFLRKNHSIIIAGLYYLVLGLRLSGATTRQAVRCMLGRATSSEFRERFERQIKFLFLRSPQTGC